jgi:hypothetical protein
MMEAPDDLAQSVNSRAVHFTSLCENSDPILALAEAGSKGSASAPTRKIPATPVASAVRTIVPRFPGESMDSTASQNEFRSGRTLAIGVQCWRTTAPIPCGAAARVSSRYSGRESCTLGTPDFRSLCASFRPNGLDRIDGSMNRDSIGARCSTARATWRMPSIR